VIRFSIPGTATVFAMCGNDDRVRPHLDGALAAVNPAEYRGFAARAHHAAGLAALAEGDYVTAYPQLSQLFDGEGTPLHHHVSYLGIADYAAAAVRAERSYEARTVVERAMARVDPAPGQRLEQLAARARGLLAEPADAGDHFAVALSRPAGEVWPFERAQLQLDYGNGCAGNAGSTRRRTCSPWRSGRSAAWAPHRGPGAPRPNCAPAA
jgi:hypothetical protein